MPPPLTILLPNDKRLEPVLGPEDHKLLLTDLLRRHDAPLNTRCGEKSLCDGCLIDLVHGQLTHARTGEQARPTHGTPPRLRACEYRLSDQPVTLRIPTRSLLAQQPQIVANFKVRVPCALAPLWTQQFIEESDNTRVTEYLPQGPIAKTLNRTLTRPLGAAVDVGTTTVALLLVDLATGRVLSRASAFNAQMKFGDDVLTRINLCLSDPTKVQTLQMAVNSRTILPLLAEACENIQADLDDMACMTLAGNTTMQHLVAGVDPSPMGTAPFTPSFVEWRTHKAHDIHMTRKDSRPSDMTVHLLPSCAAYVGADLSAGAFCTSLAYDEGPSLLVDVGTNGEILLKHRGKITGCATAAGPAFEGAGMSSGTRAVEGAISHIRAVNGALLYDVIGQDPAGKTVTPMGICGSAYLDFLAQGRAAGLLTLSGRFSADMPEGMLKHVTSENGYGKSFELLKNEHATIAITETDVARLLQAKAAIAAGILTLLERANLTPHDVKTLYLAGGFGMHMDIDSAIRSGLLPGFTPEQVQVVGNTSLAGAYLSLIDRGAMQEIARIAQHVEVIELNLDPGFEDRYVDQLMLE